jgi:hypothetical protein
LKIAHIVNPVKVDSDRDMHFQQPITFKSLRNAKKYASKILPELEIVLVETAYPEDQDVVNCTDFIKTAPLEMSILDIGSFKTDRKLPLFKEMISKLHGAVPDADYYIQTNADIAVMPFFYVLIHDIIQDGNVSFCINKRLLPEGLKEAPLSMLYSFVGTKHAGHDTFVFPAKLYSKIDLGNICMGTPWSECTMIVSLIRYAKNFTVFKDIHATFHLGDRRIWLPSQYNDYRINNTNEFARILRKLKHKQVMEHDTIKYLLSKLKREVEGYKNETYSEDCHHFITKM